MTLKQIQFDVIKLNVIRSTWKSAKWDSSDLILEPFGASRNLPEPLGASYLSGGLPFGRPPDKYPPRLCPASPMPALYQLKAFERGASKPASASCPEPRVSAATGSELKSLNRCYRIECDWPKVELDQKEFSRLGPPAGAPNQA